MPAPMSRSSQARVTVFALAGAVAGVVPLPIVPRRILRAIRGAMAHDVCAQHALALTSEARDVLAEPGGERPTLARDALAYVAGRALARLNPYATVLNPLRTAIETLAFGRLLERYLTKYRAASKRGRIVRIDGEEALEIRRLLDRALMRAIQPGLVSEADPAMEAPEDYRGSVQKAVDSAMITAARLPEIIATRLDSALDAVATGMRDGEHA